jgi:hypothetical protein
VGSGTDTDWIFSQLVADLVDDAHELCVRRLQQHHVRYEKCVIFLVHNLNATHERPSLGRGETKLTPKHADLSDERLERFGEQVRYC